MHILPDFTSYLVLMTVIGNIAVPTKDRAVNPRPIFCKNVGSSLKKEQKHKLVRDLFHSKQLITFRTRLTDHVGDKDLQAIRT